MILKYLEGAHCKLHTFHSWLEENFYWYKKWHETSFAHGLHTAILLVAIVMSFCGVLGYANASLSTSVNIEALYYETNKIREEHNLAPLKLNPILSEAADFKSKDMLAHGYFGHENPEGAYIFDKVRQLGYDYSILGENLAKNMASAEEIIQSWLESPKHRENLLNPEYKDLGIGIESGEDSGLPLIYVTEIYGAKQEK